MVVDQLSRHVVAEALGVGARLQKLAIRSFGTVVLPISHPPVREQTPGPSIFRRSRSGERWGGGNVFICNKLGPRLSNSRRGRSTSVGLDPGHPEVVGFRAS
jgi:hypothetical protein